MAIASATNLASKPVWSKDAGNHGIYYGTITATPATGDTWRFCKIPAGMRVLRVSVVNADLGTAAPADIGFAPVDGSTATTTAFATAAAWGTASTAGAPTTYTFADAPVSVTEDSYLVATFGTINTGNSGAVSVIVEGELFGAK